MSYSPYDDMSAVIVNRADTCSLSHHAGMRACVMIGHDFVSRPRIAPAIAEDCYVLVMLFIFLFFSPPIFRRPCAYFCETLPHDPVCPEIVYLLYRGIHMCPLKTEGRKPPIFAHMSTQNRHFQLRHSLVRENRKIYNNRVNLWRVHTKHGRVPTHL